MTVDPQRPITVYYQPTYARINGRAVIQLDYFVWFSERPAMGKHDPEATAVSTVWSLAGDPRCGMASRSCMTPST